MVSMENILFSFFTVKFNTYYLFSLDLMYYYDPQISEPYVNLEVYVWIINLQPLHLVLGHLRPSQGQVFQLLS